MKIERIQLRDFKPFEQLELELDPNVTLLIGENGAGKTSVLEALSIVAGVWLYDVPDSKLSNSRRSLTDVDIRLVPDQSSGDRIQFRETQSTAVSGWGKLAADENTIQWTQTISHGKKSKTGLAVAREFIKSRYELDEQGNEVLLPVIGYYGAGRASLTHRKRREQIKPSMEKSRRWAAFYDCLNERIRFSDLKQWFLRETTERGNRNGNDRSGFKIVKQAIINCIPDATAVWFDTDRMDIVVAIGETVQPSENMSAGQRMMLGLIADIAIKCVVQNNFLVRPSQVEKDEPQEVLDKTPGVILIDEVDVHLHPSWQRRVIRDLVSTFPSIQFVCTTHSPQVLGEIKHDQVYQLKNGHAARLHQSFGLESSWLLDHAMQASSKSGVVSEELSKIQKAMNEMDLAKAETSLNALRNLTGPSPDVVRLETALRRLRQNIGS